MDQRSNTEGATSEERSPTTPDTVDIPDAPLPFTGGRLPISEKERRFVARRVILQSFVAPALSFATVLIGFELDWPRLIAIGVIGFGLSALLVGYFACSEQRLMFIRETAERPEYRYCIYEGFAALPYGLTFVVVGFSVITPAVLFLTGTSLEQMRKTVLARPSLALIPLGLALLFHGLGFVIGFGRRATSIGNRLWNEFQNLPARLGGLILITWAAALLSVGMIEWLSPKLFQLWFQSFFGNPWPFNTR